MNCSRGDLVLVYFPHSDLYKRMLNTPGDDVCFPHLMW
jgi:hypothetical protein